MDQHRIEYLKRIFKSFDSIGIDIANELLAGVIELQADNEQLQKERQRYRKAHYESVDKVNEVELKNAELQAVADKRECTKPNRACPDCGDRFSDVCRFKKEDYTLPEVLKRQEAANNPPAEKEPQDAQE